MSGRAHSQFKSNVTYKIQSIADRSVVDLAASETSAEAKLINHFHNHNGPNQKFLATERGNESFRLSSVYQGKSLQVWDYNVGQNLLSQYPAHDGVNQLFYAKETYPNSGIVRIHSVHNAFCIKNNGEGKQVSLVPVNPSDIYQQWNIFQTN